MSATYGLMAEFDRSESMLAALRYLREQGYVAVEGYAPFPVEGLDEAVGFTRNRVPLLALCGGIVGGVGGFFMQWYSAVISYPFNVGGRPTNSWPAFIPVTFEMTVLCAALAGFFGLWILNGLPRLRHPVFNAPHFQLATRNRFFVCVRSDDPKYALEPLRLAFDRFAPTSVHEVPA
jgi:hypothetical protein